MRATLVAHSVWARTCVHAVERRAMQEAMGRRTRWRACSFADRAILFWSCVRHEHVTGCERLGRQRCEWFEHCREWHARDKCSVRQREQLGKGATRARRGQARTRLLRWHLDAAQPSPARRSAFELNADFEIIKLIRLIQDYQPDTTLSALIILYQPVLNLSQIY